MHPGAVREVLLRNAEPFALCPHSAAESLEVGLAHIVGCLAVMPIRLQPMSISSALDPRPTTFSASSTAARVGWPTAIGERSEAAYDRGLRARSGGCPQLEAATTVSVRREPS